MDPANHQLIQDILNSDRFIDWALQKTIQEMVIFPSEEYAVCAYVSELAHCSPLQAFPQSSVHGGLTCSLLINTHYRFLEH